MKKRLLYYFLFFIGFVAVFEFYLFYLLPYDMNFSDFLSSAFYSVIEPESNKIIRINLYNKSLAMIENGELKKMTKIAAAGDPKTSPTPTGDFKIIGKKEKVISFTGLIMPLSLRFKGPYFLHGIPTTKDGRIYSSVYSSGCIRLGPGTDQEIYNWSDIGTKVQIYKTSLVKSDSNPTVYYLNENGFKEPISNPIEFLEKGFKWKNVEIIPLIELEALPLASSTFSALK